MSFNKAIAARQRFRTQIAGIALPVFILLCVVVHPTLAQNTLNNFSSGSTGADGAFAPSASQTIVVPESGVFNYTTVSIPSGVTITYTRNSKNMPVKILASGDVTITGGINLDGKNGNNNGGGGSGGPGGYNGGTSGYGGGTTYMGLAGDGPGGGTGGGGVSGSNNYSGGGGGGFSDVGGNPTGQSASAVAGQGGLRYGTAALQPLVGGSGGGGGGARTSGIGGSGGGGGGAILIASSTKITLSGNIITRGGSGGSPGAAGGGGGGGGAGGAIRLVANTIAGNGYLYVYGGGGSSGTYNSASYPSGGKGAPGYIRVEAYDYTTFNPSADPIFISFALPHETAPANAPQLSITSVAGIAAPASPLGSLHGVPDIVVPTSQTNPVTVAIRGTNIPLGAVVQVTLTPASGQRATAQSGALAGTEAASEATASVSLPAGMSVITANVVIDATTAKTGKPPIYMEGERVNRIEVAATFGGTSELTYITESGRRIRKLSE